MNRRRLLKLGTSLGVLGGVTLFGRYALLPPRRSRSLDTVQNLALRLFEALDPPARERACVDYDHPLRQYHNRGVGGGGLEIDILNLSRAQRGILTDLLHAGLSEQGRGRVPNQFFISWPGIHLMKLLICGDPSAPPYQIVLSGPHLNLRLGGRSREGVAFGGPQVYGDQRGDYLQGLPGNVYRYQFQIADRLFRSLQPAQQRAALQAEAPIQTQIELQGSRGSFPGVALSTLSRESRRLARELVDGILSNYPPQDVEYAWQCLDHNTGLDGLFLSYYGEGEVARSGEYQIFRLEGPAAVLYFRGHPHVHAFINIGMDGDRPLSVGELLGENPSVLENGAVRELFEDAMRGQTGADLAYYAPQSVAGRLRAGPIRTGDIYTLECWQDSVTVVEVKGARLAPAFVEELRGRGTDPDPGRVYTIATTGHVARELAPERLGRVESRQPGVLLREATIAHLRERGFSRGV